MNLVVSGNHDQIGTLMRVFAVLFLFLLVGCGTTPSQQQVARDSVDVQAESRQEIRTIRYGDTMQSVHQALSGQFTPYMDVQTSTGLYSIEHFGVSQYYWGRGSESYLALYKENRLVAIALWNDVNPRSANMILLQVQQLVTNKDKDKCDLYTSPLYYEKLVADIQAHKLKATDKSFIPSEEEIHREIAALSDKEGKQITGRDAAELAAMSPLLMVALPVSVAVGVVAAPVVIPVQAAIEKKSDKESARRADMTRELLPTVRAVPLGLTMAETDRLEAEKIPGIKASRPGKTRCSTVIVGKALGMTYNEVYLYNNDRTFARLYVKAKSFW